MKTGTTFLQALMEANKKAMASAGFLFPGHKWSDQSRAVREVLDFEVTDPRGPGDSSGMWEELSAQMLGHDGVASVLSMEFLSYADSERARRVVESFDGAEVHVILTVRDAASAIPAQWQTSCRNGAKVPLRKFVQGVGALLGDDPEHRGGARIFQRTQGVDRMLDVWVPLVGRKHVHVVTLPPRGSDPDVLWHRFAGVVGIDPSVCPDRTVDTNPSLGFASTELLRRVNAELGKVEYFDYTRSVKRQLARGALGSRAHLESPVPLHRQGRRFAARWNRRVREAVERHGVELVGTLDDLPVTPPDPDVPKALTMPSTEELLEAAATGVDGLRSWSEMLHRAQEDGVGSAAFKALAIDLADPHTAAPATSPDRWSGDQDPVAAAVRELVASLRGCIELRRELEELEAAALASASAASS
jgi:hypothetical protein